jgi:hypothetical protein
MRLNYEKRITLRGLVGIIIVVRFVFGFLGSADQGAVPIRVEAAAPSSHGGPSIVEGIDLSGKRAGKVDGTLATLRPNLTLRDSAPPAAGHLGWRLFRAHSGESRSSTNREIRC